MEIIPLNDHVLLEEIHKQFESNLIISDDIDKERSNKCKVIKGGKLVVDGETVLIKTHLFDEIELENKKYLIGKEENIIARIS